MLPREAIDDFLPFGIEAFTTTRAAGSFNTLTSEPVAAVMGRWYALRGELLAAAPRFATARQVHGADVAEHAAGWRGWLRVDAADGHFAAARGTAMAVTVADCVPVFVAHPSGAIALLHAGWRGTAARILERGIAAFARHGMRASELRVHLGPSICGRCYEVSPDVYGELTGRLPERPTPIDLRALLADQAAAAGVREIATSGACTRCDNGRFYSHRAGDDGRQLGVMVARGG
jgi:YfiH family protein